MAKMIKNFKTTHSLYLLSGSYLLVDAKDNKLLLNINYHKGNYDLVAFGASHVMQNEAKLLAKDLIERKSKVNLVK